MRPLQSILLLVACISTTNKVQAFAVRPRESVILRRFFSENHSKKPWDRKSLPDRNPTLGELERIMPDEQIDMAIDEIAGLQGGDIIRRYYPERWWLWGRWDGTVIRHTLGSAVFNMSVSLIVCLAIRKITHGSWAIGLAPDTDHVLIGRLTVFDKLWHYLMTLTTFILTFFVGQAYSLWRDMYNVGRAIQGRLNDISLLLATHASRRDDGQYTLGAKNLLEDVSGYLRLFHVLLWASLARRFRVLLTSRGLERMACRGILSHRQKDTLEHLDLPPNQKHNACLEWAIIRCQRGLEENTIRGGDALEHVLLEKACALRGLYAGIGDKLDGRMPLAYVHFVQVMVDIFLFCAPLALYSELGAFSIVSVGILTFFYTGLLDLAKVFLDPLDNEDYCEGSVYMDLGVLIRESNAGSIRWMNGASSLPF